MNINFDSASRQPKSLLARAVTLIIGIAVLATAFMFSLVFFAILAVFGLVFWLYFLWKTRALRQQIREQMNEQMREPPFDPQTTESAASGEVIEGEAVRVVEERDK